MVIIAITEIKLRSNYDQTARQKRLVVRSEGDGLTGKKTEELDFSPFNAEDVLTALCKVLRTSKAISFSYAGDIQSLIDRIGRVFHSARCMMFVAGKAGSQVEIFEYVAEGIEPVARNFAGMFTTNAKFNRATANSGIESLN